MTRYAKAKGRANSADAAWKTASKRDPGMCSSSRWRSFGSLVSAWNNRADALNELEATPKPKRRRDLCSARRKAKAEGRSYDTPIVPANKNAPRRVLREAKRLMKRFFSKATMPYIYTYSTSAIGPIGQYTTTNH